MSTQTDDNNAPGSSANDAMSVYLQKHVGDESFLPRIFRAHDTDSMLGLSPRSSSVMSLISISSNGSALRGHHGFDTDRIVFGIVGADNRSGGSGALDMSMTTLPAPDNTDRDSRDRDMLHFHILPGSGNPLSNHHLHPVYPIALLPQDLEASLEPAMTDAESLAIIGDQYIRITPLKYAAMACTIFFGIGVLYIMEYYGSGTSALEICFIALFVALMLSLITLM